MRPCNAVEPQLAVAPIEPITTVLAPSDVAAHRLPEKIGQSHTGVQQLVTAEKNGDRPFLQSCKVGARTAATRPERVQFCPAPFPPDWPH